MSLIYPGEKGNPQTTYTPQHYRLPPKKAPPKAPEREGRVENESKKGVRKTFSSHFCPIKYSQKHSHQIFFTGI